MRTVRARLTGFTMLVVAAILVLMGIFVRYRVQSNLISEIDRDLKRDIGTVTTGQTATKPPIREPIPAGSFMKAFIRNGKPKSGEPDPGNENTVMQVLRSPKAEVRLEAKWNAPRLIPVKDQNAADLMAPIEDPTALSLALKVRVYHDYVKEGQARRSLTAPVRRGEETVAYVQAFRPLAPVRRQLADLDGALATSIPFAVIMAALGGAVLVGSALRPVRSMKESAQRLEGDLSGARLPVAGRDEFAELAATINAAFDRTASAFAEQRRALAQLERFTGDAGHELRTPLASIKTNASYLLHLANVPAEHRPPLEMIDTCADRMTKLIADLLLLAQQDGQAPNLCLNSVDVALLVEDVVDQLPTEDGPIVEVVTKESLTVRVDHDSVERVLLNLVSNAMRHARAKVSIDYRISGTYLALEVSDDGPGIAPDDMARLGERFFRPDEARSRHQGGVGLGIAIARSLTESHGGGLTIDSVPNEKTVFRARFRLDPLSR